MACSPRGPGYRLTIAVSAAVAIIICAWGTPAHASDTQAKAPVRLAAVSSGAPLLPHRPQGAIDALRLVQHLAPDSTAALASEDLIIVAVDASTPESLDEEIAREHKLDLVRRLVMSGVGLRVLSYRSVEAQPLAEILERLRADSRITSAQGNVAYRPLEPTTPGDRLTSVKPPEMRSGNSDLGKRQKSAAPRMGGKAAGSNTTSRPGTVKADAGPSARVGGLVADVLAGGL